MKFLGLFPMLAIVCFVASLSAGCVSAGGERSYNHRPISEENIIALPNVSDPSNAATITVMRDAHIWGAAMAPVLLFNGEEVAHIPNGSSLTFQVDAGHHLVGMRSLGNDAVSTMTLGLRRPTEIFERELFAEPQQHYHFRIETRGGQSNFTFQRTSS